MDPTQQPQSTPPASDENQPSFTPPPAPADTLAQDSQPITEPAAEPVTEPAAEQPAVPAEQWGEAPVSAPEAGFAPEQPAPAPFGQPSPQLTEPAAVPVPQPAQAAPFTPGMPAAPVMPPPKKSKKGLIIGLVAGIGGLMLLAGIAAIVWFTQFYVSKADYQQAVSVYNEMASLNKDLIDSSSATSSSQSPDTIDTKITQLDQKAGEFGKLRAVQKDADIHKVYADFSPTLNEYVSKLHSLVVFLRAGQTCEGVTTKSEASACVDKLRAIKEDNFSELNEFAAALADSYDAALDGQYKSYYDAQTKFQDALEAIDSKMESKGDALKEVVVKKAA